MEALPLYGIYGFYLTAGLFFGIVVGWIASRAKDGLTGTKCPTCKSYMRKDWKTPELEEEDYEQSAPLWASFFLWKMLELGYPVSEVQKVGMLMKDYDGR